VILALSIFGIGWLIAIWANRSILRALHRENIPRASLIARLIKTVLIMFFSAMALVELDIARQVVIIGFATLFITLGAVTILIVASGGKDVLKKSDKPPEEK
jgi:drug/metabolite transporter (DMT)-like permease